MVSEDLQLGVLLLLSGGCWWCLGWLWRDASARREQQRLRAALGAIRDQCGQVCERFEVCEHVACNASYQAWARADEALYSDRSS